jgi:hypothetical protein
MSLIKYLRGAFVAAALVLVPTASADAATRYVSTSGSDDSACTQAAPCKSFNAAYAKAAAGDVVEVAAGTYGGQSLAARALTGTKVTVRPAAGASVTLSGSLDINTSNIIVQGFKASDLNVDNGSTVLSDVTTVGIDATSAYFQNTRNLVVKGGRLGGLNNKTPVYVGAWPMSYNVTFDGVTFHDATVTDSTVHTECLMVNDMQGMTIKNSRFTNCGYFGLMISHLMGELPPRDVTLENNVFEQTYQWNGQPAPYSMLIGPIDANHFVIRNNTFVSEPTFNNTTWSNGSKFVGNLGALNKCQSGAAYANNVWTGVTCGTTDKRTSNLSANFVDPANHNWRLKAGVSAVDAASKTDYPTTDQDGKARPAGAAPDAGAFEYGSAAAAPPAAPPPATPALVAAYGFNETSGTTFRDASGHGLTGTRMGATTQVTTAKYGRALSFNGTSYATVADNNRLDVKAMTIEAWVRPTVIAGHTRTVIYKGRTGGSSYALYAANTDGFVTGGAFNGADRWAMGPSALPLATWSHIATTYDGAALRLYVNGKLVRTTATSGPLTAGTGPLTFGGHSGQWFQGQIDDVRIYDGALSQAAIAKDMTTSITT